jgi:hypothetical protein
MRGTETRSLCCPWTLTSPLQSNARSNKNSAYVPTHFSLPTRFPHPTLSPHQPDRKKVLKHHPDKKAGLAGHSANDDAFFKCISKAHEVLSNPTRRAQFDSVDPHYATLEDDVPTASQFAKWDEKKERKFFELFGPVFERESRFSRVTPVPLLGGPDAEKAEVESFYDFWYNFDSWRSFEYLDKEVNEGSDKCAFFCFALTTFLC